jgi:hypothetical protein
MSVQDLLNTNTLSWRHLYVESINISGSSTLSNLSVNGNFITTGLSGTTTSLTRGNSNLTIANNNAALTSAGGYFASEASRVIAISGNSSCDINNTRILLSSTSNTLSINSSLTRFTNGSNTFDIGTTSIGSFVGSNADVLTSSLCATTTGNTVVTQNNTQWTTVVNTNTLYVDTNITLTTGNLIQGSIVTDTRSKYLLGTNVLGGIGMNSMLFVARCTSSGANITLTSQWGGISSAIYNSTGNFTINLIPLNPVASYVSAMVMTSSGTFGPDAMTMCYRCAYPDNNTVNVQTFNSNSSLPLDLSSFDIWILRY